MYNHKVLGVLPNDLCSVHVAYYIFKYSFRGN